MREHVIREHVVREHGKKRQNNFFHFLKITFTIKNLMKLLLTANFLYQAAYPNMMLIIGIPFYCDSHFLAYATCLTDRDCVQNFEHQDGLPSKVKKKETSQKESMRSIGD